ncbi:hypothetical protein AJ79_01972 [Helicocarpus griseus UAMH5409]|uniref:ERCC4 domain-containing protein n=1 Tax=Helicocarpus griseus UAMH5409 TaxID=1447875 RepID=A0A2B7XWP8_9EURO|nr:hypothetical protein AJ79_01972 [Helicocarpus griseus UAMH5409]
MPEVISLLSSPEEARPPRSPTAIPEQPTRASRIPIFSDDSIFDSGDPQPPKRRRLSPAIDLSSPREPAPQPKTNSLLFSDFEDSFTSSPVTRLNNGHIISDGAKNTKWNVEFSDPIEFTSSAVDPTTAHGGDGRAEKSRAVITIEDSIVEFDELSSPGAHFRASSPPVSKSHLSNRTASLLSRIQNRESAEPSKPKKRGTSAAAEKSKAPSSKVDVAKLSQTVDSDGDSALPAPATSKPKRTTKSSTADREAREAERQAAKARREREKEKEKERKQRLKEQKAKEKQLAADLAEANKRKFDKKITTPEMIIDISSSLEESSVGNQVTEYMRHHGVEKHFVPTRMPNVISWRRKITALYNEEAGHWEPCAPTIKKEDHVLCLLSAREFVDMSVAREHSDGTLEAHVLKMKRTYSGCKPIYLIEGLHIWMRKSNNSKNRAYQASVLRELEGSSQPQPSEPPKRSRKPKQTAPPPPLVDDDQIEDSLLQLQVQHGCLVHQTAAPADSAEWIKNFTEHISTIPYRQELINLHDASFCMDVGQVKTGEDNADTYVKMLQEIQRVTAPISYGVMMEYPTVGELVRELKQQGPLLLEDVKKCANKTGALTGTRVGPAVSKRLHKVFTGLNPASTDV